MKYHYDRQERSSFKNYRYNYRWGVTQIKTYTKKYIVGIVASLGLAVAVPLAAHAIGGGPVCSVPTDYATIQLAINDPVCTTINVAAGTYSEHVAINRSVTLNGANFGVAGNGTRGAETIVDGTDTGAPFAITANNVSIVGFTVKNGSGGGLNSGIWSQTGTQNSIIRNNIITANDFGVWAQCGGNCLIQTNLFDANNKPGPGTDSISADNTTGLTINNNEFKNDSAGNPILMQAVAPGAHTSLAITNNNFHNNTNSSVMYLLGVTGGNITGNTIHPASGVTGISLSGADANFSITNNVITGGARGVRVEDAGYYSSAGANSNIVVHRNNVSNNSDYGVGNTDTTINSLNATCNWWGAANGPGPVATGSGSNVTTNVAFSPWLTSANLSGSCGSTSPTNRDQCKNGGWQNLTDINSRSFKNQGDCVSFVATNDKNKANG